MFEEFENEFKLNDAINFINEDGQNELIPENNEQREIIKNFCYVGQVLTTEDVAEIRGLLAFAYARIETLEEVRAIYSDLDEICKRGDENELEDD